MSDVPVHLINVEQEKAVLGVVLGSPERLELARDILPDGSAFADERHQRIYGYVLQLADGSKGFDVVTLKAALKASGDLSACGGEEYITSLRDGWPKASLVAEYARRVHDLWRQRQAFLTLADLSARFAAPGGFDGHDPIDVALGRLSELDVGAGGLSFIDGPAISKRAMELLQAGTEGKTRGLSTGFPTLDATLGGGLLGGKLYVIGGRPGTGKSALVENIALNIATRQTVCVFSQEMDADENIERFVAILAGVDMNRVRQGAIAQAEYGRIVHASETLFASHLRLNDGTGITAHAVRAAVRREQARGPIGAVVIDYLQMMSAGTNRRRAERRDQELGYITKELKRLAKDLRVPVLLVASLNRGSENRTGDKRPHLTDLRDSGEIESDADVVLFTYRDELVDEKTEDKNITELIIRKGRGCKFGTIKLRFDPEYTRFRELDMWRAA